MQMINPLYLQEQAALALEHKGPVCWFKLKVYVAGYLVFGNDQNAYMLREKHKIIKYTK